MTDKLQSILQAEGLEHLLPTLVEMSGNVWEFCWESGRPEIGVSVHFLSFFLKPIDGNLIVEGI